MKRCLLLLFLLSVLIMGYSQQKANESWQLVMVYPRYLEYVTANYIKGLTGVKFDIGANGTVIRIVLLRPEPHNLFHDEAVETMAKQRFGKNRLCQRVGRQFILAPSCPWCFQVERGWKQEKNEGVSGYISVMVGKE